MFNRCLTRKLNGLVPIGKWTVSKQNVSHLKVFSSVCYKHVPNAKRRKLDDKSRVMLLIGYHSTCAYKLYCLVTNKVEIRKDVIVKNQKHWIGTSINLTLVHC